MWTDFAAAAGWIVAFLLAALHVLRSRWHAAELAQLRRQLADTEREFFASVRGRQVAEAALRDLRLMLPRGVRDIFFCE